MISFKKTCRALGAGAAVMTFAAGGMATKAQGAVYLVGMAEYVPLDSDNNGSNHFGYYHSTTNSTDHGVKALNLSPGGSSAISVLLNAGNNNFTITPGIDSSPNLADGEGSAAMFFFNNTGTSYNPNNNTGPGIAGDLVVWASAGSSAFHIPAANTQVLDYLGYNDNGQNDPFQASYSGATSFTIGNEQITVTAFTAGDKGANPSDTFTLTVTEVPEPTSLGFIAAVGGSMLMQRRRRMR